MSTERNVMPQVGAKFFLSPDGDEMFEFVIDGRNKIGPRKATEHDKDKHADAYNQFLVDETALPGEKGTETSDTAPPKRRGRPPGKKE